MGVCVFGGHLPGVCVSKMWLQKRWSLALQRGWWRLVLVKQWAGHASRRMNEWRQRRVLAGLDVCSSSGTPMCWWTQTNAGASGCR